MSTVFPPNSDRDPGFPANRTSPFSTWAGTTARPTAFNRRRTCAGQHPPAVHEKGDVRLKSVRQTRPLNRAMFGLAWERYAPATSWRRNRRPHVAPPLAGLSTPCPWCRSPFDPKRRCGQGVGNPTSTSARATPAHAEACATVDELGDVRRYAGLTATMNGSLPVLLRRPRHELGDVLFFALRGGTPGADRSGRRCRAEVFPKICVQFSVAIDSIP